LEIQTLRSFANPIGVGSVAYIEQLASFSGTGIPPYAMVTFSQDSIGTFSGDLMSTFSENP
jgi:hypothetical protein